MILLTQNNLELTTTEAIRLFYQHEEEKRRQLKSSINNMDDLNCTFWVRECIENTCNEDEEYNIGYVFLPNNMILVVETVCVPSFNLINYKYNCWATRIAGFGRVCYYDIVDEKIIVCNNYESTFIYEQIFLEDHYLYISFNNEEYERFRIVTKFDTCIYDAFH